MSSDFAPTSHIYVGLDMSLACVVPNLEGCAPLLTRTQCEVDRRV